MPDRPLILFPSPERADRERKAPSFPRIVKPSFSRQFARLQPSFNVLQAAFEQKNLKIQQSPTGINPEFALVFEIIGTVDNFYTAVKNTDGLEWMFDIETDSFLPDDDFYSISRNGQRDEGLLNGKLYCIMSNQQAMSQLLSLWQRYQDGETDVFKRGFAGLRDVFTHIKNIRRWNAQDRIAETHAIDYWRESLEFDGNSPVPFEIELFFRSDFQKRHIAVDTISREIQSLGGRIIQEYIVFSFESGCDTSEPQVSYISRACSSLVRQPYHIPNRFLLKISGLETILATKKGRRDGRSFYMDEYTLIFLFSWCIRCAQKRYCWERRCPPASLRSGR